MTKPIFSDAFYAYDLFSNDKHKTLVVGGDNKLQLRESSFYFWKYRSIHVAVVDGTITTMPFSFFGEIKRYFFRLRRNSYLTDACRRIKSIATNTSYTLDPLLQELKKNATRVIDSELRKALVEEAHSKGVIGCRNLLRNLKTLSANAQKRNQTNRWLDFIYKIANFFLNALGMRARYAHVPYQDFDLSKLEEVLLKALELKVEDIKDSPWDSTVQILKQNGESETLDFDEDNLRLECGLITELPFRVQDYSFFIKYDKTKEEFILSYQSLTLFLEFMVIEKLDDQEIKHRLAPFNSPGNKTFEIRMKKDAEYFVHLPKDKIYLKFTKKP